MKAGGSLTSLGGGAADLTIASFAIGLKTHCINGPRVGAPDSSHLLIKRRV